MCFTGAQGRILECLNAVEKNSCVQLTINSYLKISYKVSLILTKVLYMQPTCISSGRILL
jgi:hypothetical protein